MYLKKFLQPDRIKPVIESIRKKGKKISFTNGCFDILHPGHLDLLYHCRNLADVLMIALNTDESIRALKGDKRPVFSLEQRVLMLAGYSFVDYIVSFSEESPLGIIQIIRPDFLVKGADWGHGRIIGEDFVRNYGGKVIAYPIIGDYSTSGIIDSIISRYS